MLTATQRRNLVKLADYLESLPKSYKHFEMKSYFIRNGITRADEVRYAKKNGGLDQFPCGTVACAVGHGPSAGVLFRPGDIDVWGEPNWNFYSRRFCYHGAAFIFMFGSDWSRVDNHHWGAAARIRYILEDGEVPMEDDGYTVRISRGVRKLYRHLDKRYA